MSDETKGRWRLVPCFIDQGVWYEVSSDARTCEGTLKAAKARAEKFVGSGWDAVRIDMHGVASVGSEEMRA